MSDSTSELACGYCLSPLDGLSTTICPECKLRYHTDCWQESGGCSQFGCPDWLRRQMTGGAQPSDSGPTASVSGLPLPLPMPGPPATGAAPDALAPAPRLSPPSMLPRPPLVQQAVKPAAPLGGWHPDPLERHQHRYWNGRKWTAMVSDAGRPSTDPYGIVPTPLVPPGGDNAAAAKWYPDPSGRHQYRYWNGRRWLERVADNGIESTDAPTLKGS